jgi:uncharacterized protein YdaU (DUF1376 family)
MPLYVADYLADTAHLTAAEHGAYLLLIMHYWSKGRLPDDEAAIARITRLSARQWSHSRDVLRSLFGDDWRHKRVDDELGKAIEKSKVNSANAKRRHSERSADAQRTHTQSQSQSDKEERKIGGADAPPKARGSRLPEDWQPSEDDLSFARSEGMSGEDTRVEIMKFKNHWSNKTGKDATKMSWSKAWRNWVLNWKRFNGGRDGKAKPSFGDIARDIGRSLAASGGVEPGGNVVGLLPDRRRA